jgi:hypothetical protein
MGSRSGPAVGEAGGPHQHDERLRMHDPCSQLNATSAAAVRAYLKNGLTVYMGKKREKVQEDVLFVRLPEGSSR